MANRSRYKQMELYVACTLLIDLVFFIIYLIAAGNGVIWLKATAAVFAFLVSALCLAFLYMNKEIYRQRSLWMSAGALAILVCTLFSLILRFPSPNPLKQENPYTITGEQEEQTSADGTTGSAEATEYIESIASTNDIVE